VCAHISLATQCATQFTLSFSPLQSAILQSRTLLSPPLFAGLFSTWHCSFFIAQDTKNFYWRCRSHITQMKSACIRKREWKTFRLSRSSQRSLSSCICIVCCVRMLLLPKIFFSLSPDIRAYEQQVSQWN
jgi:hypothetical protein